MSDEKKAPRYRFDLEGLQELVSDLAGVWAPLSNLPAYSLEASERNRMKNFTKHGKRLSLIASNGGNPSTHDMRITIEHGVHLLDDLEERFDGFVEDHIQEFRAKFDELMKIDQVRRECGSGLEIVLEKLVMLQDSEETTTKELAICYGETNQFFADAEKMVATLEREKEEEEEKRVRAKRGKNILQNLALLEV